MNYKIRITEDNQAIVKRIADENEMNPSNFEFYKIEKFYIIKNNLFYVGNVGYEENIFLNYTEITIDQFIELFDKKEKLTYSEAARKDERITNAEITKSMRENKTCKYCNAKLEPNEKEEDCIYHLNNIQITQETELDKWLRETKANNLSLVELRFKLDYLAYEDWLLLEGNTNADKAQILFNQWNNQTEESPKVETEWQPKRGDRVLVWDENDCDRESIFLTKIEGASNPIITVNILTEDDYLNNKPFYLTCYKHMKPLPIEQPKETDFKIKVIKLIEKRIENLETNLKKYHDDKSYHLANDANKNKISYENLLIQIKQL
jgi:hypothetical protein